VVIVVKKYTLVCDGNMSITCKPRKSQRKKVLGRESEEENACARDTESEEQRRGIDQQIPLPRRQHSHTAIILPSTIVFPTTHREREREGEG
jgi:hypothetical protein